MTSETQPDPYGQAWAEIESASRSLGQAGDLIKEAHAILERFCSARDQGNWDKAFAWRISELQQAQTLCEEVAAHLNSRAAAGSEG